jgi:lysozyme
VIKREGATGAALRRTTFLVVALGAALVAAVTMTAGAGPAAAAGPYLEGIDVSKWQGQVRWVDVKNAGVRFVIAKATGGTVTADPDTVDPQWARNRTRLRKVGIPFGAYHFAGPDTSPGDAVAEADHFVDTAQLTGKNLLPVLDLERHNNLDSAALIEWARAFLARVEERLGVKAMIYTGFYFWRDHMANTTWFADNGYRLWIAQWDVAEADLILPANNWGGKGWAMWQYDVRCCISGIQGQVDRDRVRGDSLFSLRIKNNR